MNVCMERVGFSASNKVKNHWLRLQCTKRIAKICRAQIPVIACNTAIFLEHHDAILQWNVQYCVQHCNVSRGP